MSDLIRHFPGTPDPMAAARQTTLPRAQIAQAIGEIRNWPGYAPTPLFRLGTMASELSLGEVLYKHEGPRFGLGSFKALGGAYAGLRVLQREVAKGRGHEVTLTDIRDGTYREDVAQITLASATDGNHGRSLAWGAQLFGAQCRIYIHAEVSEGRAQIMRDFGAEVIRIEGDYDDSVELCRIEAQENGWFVVSDTSWPGYTEPPREVMAGYGAMVDEIAEDLDQPPTHVFLQGGVGGMAASVAACLRQIYGAGAPRVCVVEPDLAACLFESAKRGHITSVEIKDETIMAGLSCGAPSPIAWQILSNEAADFLTISDSLIPPTVRRLARPHAGDPVIEAGESGVAGLAALIEACASPLMRQTLQLDPQSRVLLIGSEGVTDPDIYAQIMAEA